MTDIDSINANEILADCGKQKITAKEAQHRNRERNRMHARKTRERKKHQLVALQNRINELYLEGIRLRELVDERYTAMSLLGLSNSTGNSEFTYKPSSSICNNFHQTILAENSWLEPEEPNSGSLSVVSASSRRNRMRGKYSPQERQRIRKERNRLHAKKTRDRKKHFLEIAESLIREMQRESNLLRDYLRSLNIITSDEMDESKLREIESKKMLDQLKSNGLEDDEDDDEEDDDENYSQDATTEGQSVSVTSMDQSHIRHYHPSSPSTSEQSTTQSSLTAGLSSLNSESSLISLRNALSSRCLFNIKGASSTTPSYNVHIPSSGNKTTDIEHYLSRSSLGMFNAYCTANPLSTGLLGSSRLSGSLTSSSAQDTNSETLSSNNDSGGGTNDESAEPSLGTGDGSEDNSVVVNASLLCQVSKLSEVDAQSPRDSTSSSICTSTTKPTDLQPPPRVTGANYLKQFNSIDPNRKLPQMVKFKPANKQENREVPQKPLTDSELIDIMKSDHMSIIPFLLKRGGGALNMRNLTTSSIPSPLSRGLKREHDSIHTLDMILSDNKRKSVKTESKAFQKFPSSNTENNESYTLGLERKQQSSHVDYEDISTIVSFNTAHPMGSKTTDASAAARTAAEKKLSTDIKQLISINGSH